MLHAVDLDPDFAPNSEPVDGGYAAEVGSAIVSVTVTATEAHTGASVEVRAGADYDAAKADDPITETSPGSDQYLINEAAGFQGQGADTVILVTVTAADLASSGTHMVTVSRGAASSNQFLKSLTLNGEPVSLTDPADADTEGTVHGRAEVEVPSVTVMATPRNAGATVTIESDNDSDVVNDVVDLDVGINTIMVKVDAAVGTNTATYNIRVRRDQSDDATLSMLSLKHLPMNKMEGESIDLSPMFDSGTMSI